MNSREQADLRMQEAMKQALLREIRSTTWELMLQGRAKEMAAKYPVQVVS